MIILFEIIYLVDHHNRGHFIFARHLQVDQPLLMREGATLHGFPVYHYTAMYPMSDRDGNPRLDIYVFRCDPFRYPDGHFHVGQIVELSHPDDVANP
jgi:hypothetical protein